MIRTRLSLVVLSAGLLSGAALAASTEPVKTEIGRLLERLQRSDCEFNRNGTWYSGQEASAHLARKLDYLMAWRGLSSAEQFIDLGASESSFSGRPYLVRCQDAPVVHSRLWLLEQLSAIRRR